MMDQIKYLLALETYKFMHTNIVHVRMIMINILYTFLVIYFPDVMPSLAALTGGTQYLPQNINGMNKVYTAGRHDRLPLPYSRRPFGRNRFGA